MNGLNKRALDDYITGVHLTRSDMVKHHCRFCGNDWEASMLYDMGGWFYHNDDDAYCPKCSMEYQAGEYYKELACPLCKRNHLFTGEGLMNHLWFFHGRRVNTGINDLFNQAIQIYFKGEGNGKR